MSMMPDVDYTAQDVIRSFRKFDLPNRPGVMTTEMFMHVIRTYGNEAMGTLSEKEVLAAVEELDPNGTGFIHYEKLAQETLPT